MGVREDILAGVTLSEVIGEHIKLSQKGGEFEACCPFHEEKTPSFTVNDDKAFYHCFGCGAHGNAIDFLIEYKGLDFREALRKLAPRAGVALGRLRSGRKRDPLDNGQIWARLVNAFQFFRQQGQSLPALLPAMLDFDESVLRRYRVGYYPPLPDTEKFWKTVLRDHYDPKSINRIGLNRGGGTEPLVMLPVLLGDGKIAGIYSVNDQQRVHWHGRQKTLRPLMTREAADATPETRKTAPLVLTDDILTWMRMAADNRIAATLPWPANQYDAAPGIRGVLRTWSEVVLVLSRGTAYLYDHPLLTAVLNEYRPEMRVRVLMRPPGQTPDVDDAVPLDEFLLDRSRTDAAIHLPGGADRLRAVAQTWWRQLPESLYKFVLGERLREATNAAGAGPAGIGPVGSVKALSQINHPLALPEHCRQILRVVQEHPGAVPPVPADWPGASLINRARNPQKLTGLERGRLMAHARHCPLPKEVTGPDSAALWARRLLKRHSAENGKADIETTHYGVSP